MKMQEIRKKFLEFFEQKNHLITKSANLLVENDISLLFVNSGMAPLKKYFLNQEKPMHENLTSSQICLRVGGKHNDLADVGYTKRHHTLFEMLGNFSFGGYFKENAIDYAFEFLTKVLKIDETRIFVTIHPNDSVALNLWQKHMKLEKITKLETNIWKMGEIGPFGYCTEIFYDLQTGTGDFVEGDRFLEIWNIVFMEYYNSGTSEELLSKACIDTGMGLERITAVLENKTDTYEIEFFSENLPFLGLKKHTVDSKIILDHLRTTSVLIAQNTLPGPNGANFVLRRIVRRMLKSCQNLKLTNLDQIIPKILQNFQKYYNFEFNISQICETIMQEKNQFDKIINNGIAHFNSMLEKEGCLSAQNLFLLHDTHGFNIDLSLDIIKQNNYKADIEGFNKLMEESQNKNKKTSKMQLNYPKTKFLNEPIGKMQILDVYENYLIFNQSVFYAEGGGQVGDIGFVKNENLTLEITNTTKTNDVFLHEFKILKGTKEELENAIKNKEIFIGQINKNFRLKTTAHHSSTHILHYVLKNFVKNPKQMSSYVGPDKLRFDFECEKNLQPELLEIENQVNEFINQNYKTETFETTLENALKMGASAYFQYENTVRVVKFGPSIELCGGTHVENTSEIKFFKITKFSAIKAGIKRIEAVAGSAWIEQQMKANALLNEIKTLFKCEENEALLSKIQSALAQKNIAKKEAVIFEKVLKNEKKIGMIVCQKNCNLENLMEEKNFEALLECVENEENMQLRLKFSNNFAKIFNAKEILLHLGKLIESKGAGGRADFAQTGGKNIENKQTLLNELENILN